MAGRHHRGPDYERRAAALRARANADPRTRCEAVLADGTICGRTLAEHPPHRTGRKATWQAGHVIDGQLGGALRPEASTCNNQAGGRLGLKRMRQRRRPLHTSRRW